MYRLFRIIRWTRQFVIYTNNLTEALLAADELEAGSVIVNDIPTFRTDNMPYGGVKMSGYGREGIKYAVEEMSELKFITIQYGVN